MQQKHYLLLYDKEKCSLIRNSKELGQSKETNSSPITTNSPCCWLTEKILNHTNHQDTFLESCQLDKENMSQESETIRLILKASILKYKWLMHKQYLSVKPYSRFVAMGIVHSTQCTYTIQINYTSQ